MPLSLSKKKRADRRARATEMEENLQEYTESVRYYLRDAENEIPHVPDSAIEIEYLLGTDSQQAAEKFKCEAGFVHKVMRR